ncbi:Tll0287-like domain-containing protein [Flavisericum labens]|uniref:Tll0287-like domain-containing protein n=1 Tax=Flavisericum labens TaxID=3377112 RepID=UPI00387AF7D1
MKLIQIFVLSLLLMGCNNIEKSKTTAFPQDISQIRSEPPGKKLMETYCYVCHNAQAPEGNGRIAPPMVAIKARYLDYYNSKEDFVDAFTAFTNNPNKDNAILYGAVRRFGLMPKQAFPMGTAEKIAEYLYDYQIEEPAWFKDHIKEKGFKNYNTGRKTSVLNETEKTLEGLGLEYALSTKKVLGKNLIGAIQTKGALEALEFCNIRAIPLTDSMSVSNNAKIKRVSDKYRNPNNNANSEELQYIDLYKKEVSQNNTIQPTVIERDGKVHFYYPIVTNSMCLQCHGTSIDINPEIAEKILKLYPKDRAIGYSENQVRGIWSIEFYAP